MKCVTEHVEETTCHCRLGEDFVDKIPNKNIIGELEKMKSIKSETCTVPNAWVKKKMGKFKSMAKRKL